MSDGGTESERPRDSIAEKGGAGPAFVSAFLCLLAGVAVLAWLVVVVVVTLEWLV